MHFADGKLGFSEVSINAYFASVAADFLRQKLLDEKVSFSFETVMSAPDKVALLEKAQRIGYRTYLYFRRSSAGGRRRGFSWPSTAGSPPWR